MRLPPRFSTRALACIALAALTVCAQADQPEDELRAAVVLSFLRHVDWVSERAPKELKIAVVGRASFRETLARTVAGKTAGTAAIRMSEVGETGCCHAIYFASSQAGELSRGLAAAHAARALTFGEAGDFLARSGAVLLEVVDGRMTFEVEREAVRKAGATISAKLLRFGRIRDSGGKAR